ncbi:MAG: hypothetical protein ACRENO_04655 [Thermodesulfobacteriota bacterium]
MVKDNIEKNIIRQDTEKRAKKIASIISLIVILVVLFPIKENWSKNPKDAFPLSYYPMFTTKRGETNYVVHPIGIDKQGKTKLISYQLAGVGGFNQVRKQIRKTVIKGGSKKLCKNIASNIARTNNERYKDIVQVQVVTSEYNLSDFFQKKKQKPVNRWLHYSCPVKK